MPTSRVQFRVPFVLAVFGAALSACARGPIALAPAPSLHTDAVVAGVALSGGPTASCAGCAVEAAGDEVIRAVALRVSDLKARGGACEAYGTVLEGSLAGKRIVVRPFMWRVAGSLASAQALSTGEIDVARDVDQLNIGRRSLDDVVHSVEHEAVHIAFAIPSGAAWNEMLVNERVDGCRSRSAVVGATP